MRNSGLRRDDPIPFRHQATLTISAVPRAETRFRWTIRIWISAVRRSGGRGPVAPFRQDGAVDEQIQGAIGTQVGDLDGAPLLPPAQGLVIWHRPVQSRHLQQTGQQPNAPAGSGVTNAKTTQEMSGTCSDKQPPLARSVVRLVRQEIIADLSSGESCLPA